MRFSVSEAYNAPPGFEMNGILATANNLGYYAQIVPACDAAIKIAGSSAADLGVIPILPAESLLEGDHLARLNALYNLTGVVTFGGRTESNHIGTSHMAITARELRIPLIVARAPKRHKDGSPDEEWIKSDPLASLHGKIGSAALRRSLLVPGKKVVHLKTQS